MKRFQNTANPMSCLVSVLNKYFQIFVARYINYCAKKNPINLKNQNYARQVCLTVYTRVLALNHPNQRPVEAHKLLPIQVPGVSSNENQGGKWDVEHSGHLLTPILNLTRVQTSEVGPTV